MAVPQYNSVDVPILSFLPQWQDGLTLKVENSTEIMEALSTVEEREGKFPRPLYHPGYEIQTLTAKETATLRRILDLSEALPCGVPVWMEACKLTAQPSSSTIAVDWLDNSLFSVIRSCLIVQDYETYEVFAVSSINEAGKTITLSGTPDSGTPVGTYVVPVVYGALARGENFNQNDEVASFTVDFQETWNGLSNQTLTESGSTDDSVTPDPLTSLVDATYSGGPSAVTTLHDIVTATYSYSASITLLSSFVLEAYSIVQNALSGTDKYGFESMDQETVDGPRWRL